MPGNQSELPTADVVDAPGGGGRLPQWLLLVPAPDQRRRARCWGGVLGYIARVPLVPVARSVFTASLPAIPAHAAGLEYYIAAQSGAERLLFPATAPQMNQTVIVSAR